MRFVTDLLQIDEKIGTFEAERAVVNLTERLNRRRESFGLMHRPLGFEPGTHNVGNAL